MRKGWRTMNEFHGQDYDADKYLGAIDDEEIRVMVNDGLRSLRQLVAVWTPQSLPSPPAEQDVLEQALIEWLVDVEQVQEMKEYAGPFTTATDKLHQLARKVRDYRSGR